MIQIHWIFAHLIGDYLIQNDWMAAGKKRSTLICLVHVITYLLPFLFCGLVPWQMLVIGVEHFLQDRTNIVVWVMRHTGHGTFSQPPMAPWSIILTDNIWHMLFIALVVSIGR